MTTPGPYAECCYRWQNSAQNSSQPFLVKTLMMQCVICLDNFAQELQVNEHICRPFGIQETLLSGLLKAD